MISPFFAPAYSYGGIVKVAYDQAQGLVQRWFEVTVVTTDVFDAEKRITTLHETLDGIEVIRFKNLNNKLAKFQNLYLPGGMKTWLKKNLQKYDIIHIHDVYNLPTYRGMKYALKYQKKYFIHPHGTLSPVSIHSRKKGIKQYLLKIFKSYFDQASGFFALTEVEKKEIQAVTENQNILELPNGLYLEKFDLIPTANIHQLYDLDPQTKIISFLGRVQYIKGLDIALQILKKLDATFTDWRFLIIWPDEWEQMTLEKLAEDLGIEHKIIWYGGENTDLKYSLLKWSDLFLLLSRSEGFPMTILEALICGLPVLVSKWTKMNFSEQENIGMVVDTTNISGIEDQIITLLENKEQYAQNAIKFVQENYDIHLLLDKLIKYYES